MSVEIRPVPEKDLRRWVESVIVAFGEDVNEEQWKLDQKTLEPTRILGGYEGDKIVGGGAAFSFQMTVPGGAQVPTAGVTMVGVMNCGNSRIASFSGWSRRARGRLKTRAPSRSAFSSRWVA